MEILAPVGGWEQLEAAVRAGADAVYLGAKGFNARRNAANFDAEGLGEAVSYCHGRGVAVHVTVNTIVTDGEESALIKQADEIARAGADAVIIQDLAAYRVFKTRYPTIALHGSTQMSIHNADGARLLEEMGYQRAVLARELSEKETALIRKKTNIELESFVHGALCMSVSGQCYLSCMLGGRSGNRGLCAQPCRLDFKSGDRDYALSLKDLTLIDKLKRLSACGVCSIKIEGRMKRPEYVAAAVNACRMALDGKPVDMGALRDVFSRGGFTDGYFEGRRNSDMFGRRSKEDAEASKAVYGSLAGLYRNECPGVAVDMRFAAAAGEGSRLIVSDGNIHAEVGGEAPQPAQNRPMDGEYARKSLEKTGGTPFFVRSFEADIGEGLFMPASSLNALRRSALEALLAARSEPRPHQPSGETLPPLPEKRQAGGLGLRVCLGDISQLSEGLLEAEKIHLPIDQISPELIERLGGKLVGEMPVLSFPLTEESLKNRLEELKKLGLSAVCGHNAGAITAARDAGLELFGGYGLNIANSRALAEYRALGVKDCVLSFEISAKQAAAMVSGGPVGYMAYGHLPLMQLRSCPARGKNGCGSCRGDAVIKDRKGKNFPLWCRKREYSTLLNPDMLYLGDKPPIGVDFAMLYFTTESQAECARAFEAFSTGAPAPKKDFTRGMSNKNLL